MKTLIPSVFALVLLAGCSYFEDDADEINPVRTRPVVYGGRAAEVSLGRLPYSQTEPSDLAAQEALERRRQAFEHPDGGLYDNYTIGVSPRPGVYSQPAPETAVVPPPPRVTTEPEPLSSPTRPSSPPPVAEHTREAAAPIAKPVPGKQGYVFSPFAPNAGYVDVTGMAPGTEAKDPYTGKVFRVP